MPKKQKSQMPEPAKSDHGCMAGWVYSPAGVIRCHCGAARIFTDAEIAEIEADLKVMYN